MTEFKKYLEQARQEFAYEVGKYTVENNLALRTVSDSLLIAFDKATDKALTLTGVGYRAMDMEEILDEAQRRKVKHSVQYADYSLETWTVANDLLEYRKINLLADGSVRKVRIEYEI